MNLCGCDREDREDGVGTGDYESIKRELKTKPIYECRCDERLKTRVEEMGECVFLM